MSSARCGQPTPTGPCRRKAAAGVPCGANHPTAPPDAHTNPAVAPPAPPTDPLDPPNGIADPADWEAHGIDPDEASEWRDAGFEYVPDDARAWADTGETPDRAWQWHLYDIGTAEYSEWDALSLSPAEAGVWIQAGFDEPADVSGWIDRDANPDTAAEWAAADKEFSDPDTAGAWMDLGVGAEEASRWSWAGFNPELADTHQWITLHERTGPRSDEDALYELYGLDVSADEAAVLYHGPARPAENDTWAALVRHHHPLVRTLAAQTATDTNDLELLAADPDPDVQDAAARNPNCPPAVLEAFATGPDPALRDAAAANPNCPPPARAHAGLLND